MQPLVVSLILAALFAVSLTFDYYIGKQPTGEARPDGITALWVAAGTTYTNAAVVAVTGILLGWTIAFYVALILIGCYVASGVPMLVGDILRSHKQKNGGGSTPTDDDDPEVRSVIDKYTRIIDRNLGG